MSGSATELVDGWLLVRTVVVGALQTNCHVVADTASRRALVVDPGDEPERLLDAVADLHVTAIVLTHAHWDHVLGVAHVADALGCPVLLHPDDAPVWPHEQAHLREHGHFDAGTATADLIRCGCPPAPPAGVALWDGSARPLRDGDLLALGDDLAVRAIHTPGHTPGGCTFVVGAHAFTGDTLFPGGPGLTGWPLSDFPTIIDSIDRRLFTLPDHTVVHPGHGRPTTIGAEKPHLSAWVERGW